MKGQQVCNKASTVIITNLDWEFTVNFFPLFCMLENVHNEMRKVAKYTLSIVKHAGEVILTPASF